MLTGLRSWLFGEQRERAASGDKSKSRAKSRLHFVLVQDRTGLSTDEMTSFKREMVAVIEKYFVIEDRELDINYRRDNDMTTLLINSPVRVRRPKEEAGKAVANMGGRRSRRHGRHHNAPPPAEEDAPATDTTSPATPTS